MSLTLLASFAAVCDLLRQVLCEGRDVASFTTALTAAGTQPGKH